MAGGSNCLVSAKASSGVISGCKLSDILILYLHSWYPESYLAE